MPDGDTGTNLALTLRSMADAVNGYKDVSVSRVASRLADAGVLAARGNSGMMMSHFFLGFAEALGGRDRAGPRELAKAMRRASDSLYQAVDKPVEGTILTVVRESTEEAERSARTQTGLQPLARRILQAAYESLERTPQLLPSLREANVVDAGAKGFVRFMEGVVSLMDRGARPLPGAMELETRDAAAAAEFQDATGHSFRYCTEFIVHGSPPPERRALMNAVTSLGDSLIVTRAHSVAKIHIHTDEPTGVERALLQLGAPVDLVKVEDMRAQHELRRRATRIARVSVVTDSTCDLPTEKVMEYDVTVVPMTVMFGDETLLDQIDITHEELLDRLKDPTQPQPTTSQPPPAQLQQGFLRAAEHADRVLGIFVAGVLSGTVGQAQAVATRFEKASVHVLDSRSASFGLGFQVLRAAELAREGRDLEEITAELERVRGRSGLLLTVDTLKYLKRSGRVGKARAFLADLMGLRPVLSVDAEGTLVPVDRVHGRSALRARVIELLKQQIPSERAR
ncbi:MAG: hypothetical protein AMS21_09125, partial [Gemmatimonas sp. SG8_38_2]